MRSLLRAGAWLAASITFGACSSQPAPRGDSVAATALPLTVPNSPYLDFYENAPDPADIALTFDDGPDEVGYTNKVLDVLRAKGVKATFFINTDNAIDVNSSSFARNTVERIVAEGHELASHSVHHYDLASTSTDVWSEISGVRQTLRAIAPSSLGIRLFRAPFGSPYFGPQSRLDYVAPLVARDAVHIGWNIDSLDWKCEDESSAPQTCILNNVLGEVDAGKNGIVLLHSIHPSTANVLSRLIDSLKSRGKRFIGVEELVVHKYGKGSRYLIHCEDTSDCSPGDSCGTDALCHADGTEPPPPPPPPTTTGGWTKLPEFPYSPRRGNAFAWIGGEAVVWGGVTTAGTYLSSGAAYDPTRGTWRALPKAPLSARADLTSTYSDKAMFVFGGENYDYNYMSSSMVYDAWTNAWTRLPNAPHTMRCGPRAVWAPTTGEFVVYGCVWDSRLSIYRVSGMAVDLETRTWREIAESPLTQREGFAIAWVGDRMVVWGGAAVKNKGPNGATRADGAAYDPVTDTWSMLPEAPIAARYGASFASAGNKLLIVGGNAQGATAAFSDGAMYDAATGAWTPLPQLPSTIVDAASWTDGTKLWVWGGRQNGTLANVGYALDVATSIWSTLPTATISAAAGADAAWTGSTGFVFGGRLASGSLTDSAAIYTP